MQDIFDKIFEALAEQSLFKQRVNSAGLVLSDQEHREFLRRMRQEMRETNDLINSVKNLAEG